MIQLHTEKGRIHISLCAIPMGDDWCILLTGGDVPHLGAISISNGVTTAFPEHKEDAVTHRAVQHLKQFLSCNFAVCCGIHLDRITKDEIMDVLELCDSLIDRLLEQILKGEA